MTTSPRDPDRELVDAARAEADEPGVEPAVLVPASDAPGERVGDVIDRYKLLEPIGSGGMGTVWMAEQKEPVKRRVALKIIKLGMDTREVIARFEAERQALALMDHPHIAKVLDGGATEQGRPFFVMELVNGTPITKYCDAARSSLRERLELFNKVCGAIQHAHHKGVIHRDVKPSNVLVTLHDGVPVPMVIDFGIAKATSAELTQKTLFTRHAQIIGTPEYMAPEQAELSGLDVDTRADVYSLGVLLYELLTGTKPFNFRETLTEGYDEMLRRIREDEPPRPSTRVSTLGEEATPIAATRHVDAPALRRFLRGDLDSIVMKALEKDRRRRYETAIGFAADVERYLNDETVVARPAGTAYRLSKLIRRRKKTVAAVGAIVVLLVAGSVGTGLGLLRALDAEAEALERLIQVEEVARFQAEQFSGVDVQLMGVRLRRALLDASPPERRGELADRLAGVNFTDLALDSLQQGFFEPTLEAVDEEFADRPQVRAYLLQSIASTLHELGSIDAAIETQRRALDLTREVFGDDHGNTLRSTGSLAMMLRYAGHFEEAEAFHREALEGFRRTKGEEDVETAAVLNNYGALLRDLGEVEEGERMTREALDVRRRELGEDHEDTVQSLHNVGMLVLDQGRLDEAEEILSAALEAQRRVFGDDHPNTLVGMTSLASVLSEKGESADAETLFREALAARRRVLGDEHPDTLNSINSLGFQLHLQKRHTEAELLYREALDGRRRVLGERHPDTLDSLNNVGVLLHDRRKLAEAEPYLRASLAGRRRVLGPDHPTVPGALALLNRVLPELITAARDGSDRERLGRLLVDLGAVQLLRAEHESAEAFLAEGWEVLAEVADEDDWRLSIALSDLGAAIAGQGRRAEAEPLLIESALALLDDGAIRPHAFWWGEPAVPLAVRRVVELYDVWHTSDRSAGHDLRAAQWRRRLDELSADRR